MIDKDNYSMAVWASNDERKRYIKLLSLRDGLPKKNIKAELSSAKITFPLKSELKIYYYYFCHVKMTSFQLFALYAYLIALFCWPIRFFRCHNNLSVILLPHDMPTTQKKNYKNSASHFKDRLSLGYST